MWLVGVELSSQHDGDAVQYGVFLRSRQRADAFGELHPVDGCHLGHIGDGVFGQARRLGGQEDIPWKPFKREVRREWHNDDGGNLTEIERVGLHDDDWANETRLRPDRFAEVCPEDISLRNYHLLSRIRRAACADMTWSLGCPASEMAELIAAVTSLSV